MGAALVRAMEMGKTRMGPMSHVPCYGGSQRNPPTCCVSSYRGKAGNSPKAILKGENLLFPPSPRSPQGPNLEGTGMLPTGTVSPQQPRS